MKQKCLDRRNHPYDNMDVCDESQMCMFHCTFEGHSHCVGKFCMKTEGFCEQTTKTRCNACCNAHPHCFDCEKTTDICWEDWGDTQCVYCCSRTPDGHVYPYHCNVEDCGELENICDGCGRCPEHLHEECRKCGDFSDSESSSSDSSEMY